MTVPYFLDSQGADVEDLGKWPALRSLPDTISLIHEPMYKNWACFLWFRHDFIWFFVDDIVYATTDNPVLRPFDKKDLRDPSNPVTMMQRNRFRHGLFDMILEDQTTFKNDINQMTSRGNPVAERYERKVEAKVDLAKRQVMNYTFKWTVPADVDTSKATFTKPAPFNY